MFTKIKYFIKYGLFSFKIFENNLNDIILELKKLYYESRSDNLIKEIEKLKTSLNNYNTRTKNINISWWHKPNYNDILKLWIDIENKENISMFTKIKYFIKYGLFSFKIFENNLNDIILELKKLYYESRSDNLIKEIEKLKTSLNNYNIKKK